ncbi:MAG: hypothetical protein Q4E54_08780, partial [Lachnospiraceae bacterium]|nr:hypothetical protein [Lachnospiraceae bacterium]
GGSVFSVKPGSVFIINQYSPDRIKEIRATLFHPLIFDAHGYSYGHLENASCQDKKIAYFIKRCKAKQQCISTDDLIRVKPWYYDSIVIKNVREMTDDHSIATDVILFLKLSVIV